MNSSLDIWDLPNTGSNLESIYDCPQNRGWVLGNIQAQGQAEEEKPTRETESGLRSLAEKQVGKEVEHQSTREATERDAGNPASQG